MSMSQCPNCGQDTGITNPERADQCPHCQAFILKALETARHRAASLKQGNPPTEGKLKKSNLAFIALVGLFFAVVGTAITLSIVSPGYYHSPATSTTGAQQSNQTRGSTVGAWTACHYFVERQLVSPGTASHPPGRSSQYVTEHSNGRYTVQAWVDSQNALGATRRNQYTCQVKPATDGGWTLVNLNIQ